MEASIITLPIVVLKGKPLHFKQIRREASFILVDDIAKYSGTRIPIPVYIKDVTFAGDIQSSVRTPCGLRRCKDDKGEKYFETDIIDPDKLVILVTG